MQAPLVEQRRCGDNPRAHARLKVAPHAIGDGVAAPIGVKPLKVEPQLLGALPEVRIFETPLV